MPSIMIEQQEAMVGVSVIVCCYNSAQRLPATLSHLAQQQVSPGINWEIIIIDNASTDDTAKVARDEWMKYALSNVAFDVITEKKPGKNYALKKGIAAAMYEYILICDDDNWLFPDYITNAFIQIHTNPEVGAVGGCGLFEPEQPASPQISGFDKWYVNGPQTWAEKEHWVYGAGCIYRKRPMMLFIKNTWPLITTGRVGSKLNGGEDAEICFMLYLCGCKITYCDSLLFKHFVPLTRQCSSYIFELALWQSYSNVLLNSYYSFFNDTENIMSMLNKWLLASAWALIKNTGKRVIYKLNRGNSFSIRQQIALNSSYGTFISLLKNRRQICEHNRHIKTLLAEVKMGIHPVNA